MLNWPWWPFQTRQDVRLETQLVVHTALGAQAKEIQVISPDESFVLVWVLAVPPNAWPLCLPNKRLTDQSELMV